MDVHEQSETATVWRGIEWGHRRIVDILLVANSNSYTLNVVATRPTIYRKQHKNPL